MSSMTRPRRALRRTPLQWSAALGALLLCSSVGTAVAQSTAGADKGKQAEESAAFFAEVTVLHATHGKKGIDPRIGAMPELAKPPFSLTTATPCSIGRGSRSTSRRHEH